MRRVLTGLALLLGLPMAATACLWDRDTPASEANGMPEVVAALTGRFARNPPLFYELRLARVAAYLDDHADDLATYDDAGVACDRLGRGDEAIDWMEKKRARLERLDRGHADVKEHQYRYHANLGTFIAHRWVRQGGDRTKLGAMKAARDEIAQALAINPDAHFGREKYQLQAIDWIIDPPKVEGWEDLPNILGWNLGMIQPQPDPKEADDAVRGLAGLVVLGNAWENVDVFHALNAALQADTLGFARDRNGGRNTLAYFAWLRCRELIDAGKGSMLPDAPQGEALKRVLRRPDFVEAGLLLDPTFTRLRAEADAWQAARTAFMIARLTQGRHPDTDPHFWLGYAERPAPNLPTESVPDTYRAREARRARATELVLIGVPTLGVGLLVGLKIRRFVRARRVRITPK